MSKKILILTFVLAGCATERTYWRNLQNQIVASPIVDVALEECSYDKMMSRARYIEKYKEPREEAYAFASNIRKTAKRCMLEHGLYPVASN